MEVDMQTGSGRKIEVGRKTEVKRQTEAGLKTDEVAVKRKRKSSDNSNSTGNSNSDSKSTMRVTPVVIDKQVEGDKQREADKQTKADRQIEIVTVAAVVAWEMVGLSWWDVTQEEGGRGMAPLMYVPLSLHTTPTTPPDV
jgi:3-oxoacyl-(acyl-carrier-protein) synthase